MLLFRCWVYRIQKPIPLGIGCEMVGRFVLLLTFKEDILQREGIYVELNHYHCRETSIISCTKEKIGSQVHLRWCFGNGNEIQRSMFVAFLPYFTKANSGMKPVVDGKRHGNCFNDGPGPVAPIKLALLKERQDQTCLNNHQELKNLLAQGPTLPCWSQAN